MMHLAFVFGIGFLVVFFGAFQSLCVNSGYRLLASGNSMLIATSQALLFRQIVGPNSGTWEIVAYGVSGAAAVNMAMLIHRRMKPR